MSTEPLFREKRQEYLRAKRDQMLREFRMEFDECLEAAREMLPERVKEAHFERVIHALWWPVRGDVPDEWWDAEQLEDHYQQFLDRNEWWHAAATDPVELSDSAIDQLASILVGTSQKFKAMRPTEGCR